jgi:hypothetical protein
VKRTLLPPRFSKVRGPRRARAIERSSAQPFPLHVRHARALVLEPREHE